MKSQSIHGTEETFLRVVCGNRGSEWETGTAAACNIVTRDT